MMYVLKLNLNFEKTCVVKGQTLHKNVKLNLVVHLKV